ncbi:RING finger protein 10 [Taenia crassiceps]|uniref:RING finger protein 10 n=1 Tax=Taenia crassiceps TaxID=6207 RepID=A0ABR4Q2J5_9CEST
MASNQRRSMVPMNSCITSAWRGVNPFRRSSGRENYLHFFNGNAEFGFERGNSFGAEASAKAVCSVEKIDYVTANCQLLITPAKGSGEIYQNPDVRVPWSDVLVNDTSSKPCAVCGVQLNTSDLRRARLFPSHVPKVGDTVRLELMRRHKRSIFPMVASEVQGDQENGGREAKVASRFLSRLVVAKQEDISDLADGDIATMKALLADGKLEEADEQRFLIAKRILRKLMAEKRTMEEVATFTSEGVSSVSEDTVTDDYFFYYQEVCGHDVYLHSMNWRCLMEDFGVSNLPQEIRGKVVEVETYTMNLTLRSRYRHLRHLPLGRTFHLIEIEFESPIISAEALLLVSDMRTMRQHRREQKEARERSLTRAKEAAEDLLLSLPAESRPFARTSWAQVVPTDEDFVPLDVAMAEVLSSSRCYSSHVLQSLMPSFSSSASLSSAAAVANDVCVHRMESPERVKATSSWIDVASRGQSAGTGILTATANATATTTATCSVLPSSQATSCTPDSSAFAHDLAVASPENAQEAVSAPRSRRKKRRAKRTE